MWSSSSKYLYLHLNRHSVVYFLIMRCYQNNPWNYSLYYDRNGVIVTHGLHKRIFNAVTHGKSSTTSGAWLEYMKLTIQLPKEHNIVWNVTQTMFKAADQYLLYGSGCMHLILAEHKCLTQIFPEFTLLSVSELEIISVDYRAVRNTITIWFVQRICSIHGVSKICYDSNGKNKGDSLLENSGNNIHKWPKIYNIFQFI